MKKRNTLGLCVLLLAMLTACGQEKSMEQATQREPAAVDTEAEAEEVSGTAYDDLIGRYRELAADPDAFRDADGAGEQNFLMLAGKSGANGERTRRISWAMRSGISTVMACPSWRSDTHRNMVPICPVFLHWQTERRSWSLEKWETAIHACRMEAFFTMAAAVHRKMDGAFISLRMMEQP